MELCVLLESPQGSQSSSPEGTCKWAFLPRWRSNVTLPSGRSWDLWHSLEAFPRGYPTGLSHVPPCWESILAVKVEAVQGKQVPLEWTETSGGLLQWWHDARAPLYFLVESASSSDATGTPGILSRPSRERIPQLELRGGSRAPLDVGGTHVLPLEWRPVCRETS